MDDAIITACRNGDLDAAKAAGEKCKMRASSCFLAACERGHKHIVQWLFSMMPTLCRPLRRVRMDRDHVDHFESADALFKIGLQLARKNGHVDLCEMLESFP